jgi:hypothetical protein
MAEDTLPPKLSIMPVTAALPFCSSASPESLSSYLSLENVPVSTKRKGTAAAPPASGTFLSAVSSAAPDTPGLGRTSRGGACIAKTPRVLKTLRRGREGGNERARAERGDWKGAAISSAISSTKQRGKPRGGTHEKLHAMR